MEGDPVDWLVGATIEQGKRRRAQSDQLTYHGVEVPIWEERAVKGNPTAACEKGPPPGPGWTLIAVACKVENGQPEITSLWRRPHPWRVMLEGAGHPAPRREEPAP